jgi:hypothetical protein
MWHAQLLLITRSSTDSAGKGGVLVAGEAALVAVGHQMLSE